MKKSKGPEEIDVPEKEVEDSPRRPASFEDLLREIREGQQEKERNFDQSGQGDVLEQKPQRRDRSIEKPVSSPSYQPKSVDQPRAFRKFQGEVSEQEKPRHKTLDEQVMIDDEIEGLKSSIKVEELDAPESNSKYKSLLKNPESVKDAIILTEILNRRNF